MKNLILNASMIAILALTFSVTATATASEANSNPTVASSELKSPATQNKPSYGDNPSLGRVLLYKTGKGLQNVGDAIQRGSDNVSQRIKDNLSSADESATPNSNTASNVNTPSTLATATPNGTPLNSEQTVSTPVITVPSNTANVPITQGRLSQSSTGSSTAPATQPITHNAKSYGIGTE